MNKLYKLPHSDSLRVQTHDDICDSIKEVYHDKHYDYGDAFEKTFYEYGPVAALVRMEDKFSRIKSLVSKGEGTRHVVNESLLDTVIDLANYSIMLATELIMEKNDNLPDSEDTCDINANKCDNKNSDNYSPLMAKS